MWQSIGEFFAGLITGLANRYRVSKGRRQEYKYVGCPKCGHEILARWTETPIPGYVWTSSICPGCYWNPLEKP